MSSIENAYESTSLTQDLDQMIEDVNVFVVNLAQLNVFTAMIIMSFSVFISETQVLFSSCEVIEILINFIS